MKKGLFINSVQKREADVCPVRWRARRIGEEVSRLFAAPSFEGTILAVCSESLYLSGRGEDIFWIAKEGLPMHRRCLSVSFQPHSFSAGQRFWISDASLWIGEDMIIDLDQTEEWTPRIFGVEKAGPMKMVNDRVDQLLSNLPKPPPDSGFGPAIPVLSAMAGEGEPERISPDPFFNRALPYVFAIRKACLNEEIFQVAQIGRDLIGLGPGLTPSGDDFMGGLLFSLHWLKRIFPEDFFWDEQPILDLIDWSLSRTHPISHVILRDLSSGHGPEPLYDILNGLLLGGDPDKVFLNIDQLCGIGHSSGWDMLAGLLTGMLLARGRVNRLE